MYLKGWFLTWSDNNSLPNSSLDHISRYNQNNLNITNVNEMIVNTTNLRYMIVTKNEQCMKNQTNLFNKNKIEKYINQRDNNIVVNQKQMLNSLLNQKPNIIKIDRLIFMDENNIKTFTTNHQEIEQRVINHYSNISSIERTNKSYDPTKEL